MKLFNWLYRLPGRIVRAYPTVSLVRGSGQSSNGSGEPDDLHQS